MSDAVVIQVATGAFSLLGTIFTGVMAFLMARMDNRLNDASVAVGQVKDDLVLAGDTARHHAEKVQATLEKSDAVFSNKLNEIGSVGEKTNANVKIVHALVNSALLDQEMVSCIALRRVAELTGHPDDVSAAVLAEKVCVDHKNRQDEIDADKKDSLPSV